MLALALLLYQGLSMAHELRPAVAEITTQDNQLLINARVNIEAIVAQVGAEHTDTDTSPAATYYDQLRKFSPDELLSAFNKHSDVFLTGINIKDHAGAPLPLNIVRVHIPLIGDTRLPRDSDITLSFASTPQPTGFSWQWDIDLGSMIIRTHSSLDEEFPFSQYLQPGVRSDLIELGNLQPANSLNTIVSYVKIGFVHIIPKGLDHILFVIGLFLLTPKLSSLALQVSTFTLAHSITLALGTLGIVLLPSYWVEPLIALSISVICLENIFNKTVKPHRLALTFAFGLLHGLGFAGVLADVGLPSTYYFLSLLSFNVGVELGQLVVVSVCAATLGILFSRKHWYRAVIVKPLSLLIALVGFFWFLQRLGLIT